MNQRWWQLTGVLAGVVGFVMVGDFGEAAEHGGKEHAGTTQEHGGAATAEHAGAAVQIEPSAEQLRDLIAAYVQEQSGTTGTFAIQDEVTGATRQLEFVRVHERVGKTGGFYYSCTDMTDVTSGELLDLDFDVESRDGSLEVVDVRLHKVEGTPRYTYDDHDQRIPVP